MIIRDTPGNQAHGMILDPALDADGVKLSGRRIEIALEIGAAEIETYCQRLKTPPLLVSVLNGAYFVFADITRKLTYNFASQHAHIRARSYGKNGKKGDIKIYDCGIKDEGLALGREVIVFEDIMETGETMFEVKEWLRSAGATNVKVFTLLDKPTKRTRDVQPDWKGFDILPDQWVVGFGMDDDGKFRHYPNVVVPRKPKGRR